MGALALGEHLRGVEEHGGRSAPRGLELGDGVFAVAEILELAFLISAWFEICLVISVMLL